MLKFFHSRLVVAAAASVAVAALMVVSVGTVQAVAPQEQQENEDAKQSDEKLRRAMELESQALMESKLHLAQEAMHRVRERGQQLRLRMVQEFGQQRARAWAPRVELRRLRSSFGGSMADRVLAMSEEIELTEQQETQIRDGRRDQRRAEIERDAQIEVLDLDLDELLEDRHNANLDAVEELMQRRASLRVQGQVADMRGSQEVWNALTAEQQEKIQANRHGVYMMRGDRPHSLFFDDGEVLDFAFESDDLKFGKLFDELHLEGLEGLDGIFEFKSEDGAPFIWRFKTKPDDDAEQDDEKKEKGKTTGTAIGVSWGAQSTRTMN